MCDCITEVNAFLKPKNGALLLPLFAAPQVIIQPEKIGRGKKPPFMIATFCPFCGEKYPQDTSVMAGFAEAPPKADAA